MPRSARTDWPRDAVRRFLLPRTITSVVTTEGPVVVAESGRTVKIASVVEDGKHPKGSHTLTQLLAMISSVRDDEGQGLAEYALILALIAIVAIIALVFLGTQVSGLLNTVGKSV